jgi:hypothetical protein
MRSRKFTAISGTQLLAKYQCKGWRFNTLRDGKKQSLAVVKPVLSSAKASDQQALEQAVEKLSKRLAFTIVSSSQKQALWLALLAFR